ncbi:ribonuclease BN [Modestobacter sp. I12A-02628]|uniref:YihY/virulence factor BrkB family protein n=1 Tax=Goekera deserti TaxID=2497753 RepID=A0A7K3WAT5_9ACTN|nr:ribonuclease BN [Goekera deserti]NDI49688.1 ribonuclease BN [Goekera deserti]NEL53119.1 YihY/virulence factor BrkB family protein [Goekera deserti]
MRGRTPEQAPPAATRPPPWRGVRVEVRGLLDGVRRRLVGRDLALIGAGLTFYAGIAVVPLLAVAFALTARVTSTDQVRALTDRLAGVLPDDIGAPDALTRLAQAGVELDWLRIVLALFPMSFYGEGLRRALLRFTDHRDTLTGWRGRLLILPLVLLTPFLLYPLLLVGGQLADLAGGEGFAYGLAGVAVGYYSVLAALTLPLVWGFRVVAPERLRWRAVVPGALFTAACLSGFLQGFVLFLDLPLDIGAPFGGLTVVGGVVAVGLWLFLLHLVVIAGWLTTQALHDRLAPSG